MKDVDEKSWQEKYNEYTTRPKSKSLMLSASSIVNSDMVHFFLRHIKAHSFSLFFKASASEMPIFHIYIYTCFAFNSQFFCWVKNSAMYLEIDWFFFFILNLKRVRVCLIIIKWFQIPTRANWSEFLKVSDGVPQKLIRPSTCDEFIIIILFQPIISHFLKILICISQFFLTFLCLARRIVPPSTTIAFLNL